MSLTPGNQAGNSARIPWLRAVFLAGALLAAAPLHADLPAPKLPAPTESNPPSLIQPVDCTIGNTCYIQNYVDADPGPAARDFRCNPHSYDGHKGTDFALPSLADMARGVTVTAAAPGHVRGVRDGMEDGAYLTDPDSVKEVECGNGVAIDHGHGWETQYCHLRKGSVLAKPGQKVAAGTPLGLVGQSGLAEFPHLHFAVRYQGKPVDPFNPDGLDACALPPPQTLWQGAPPAYRPGGVLMAGFAVDLPALETIRSGTAAARILRADSAQLLLWGYLFNARAGDQVRIALSGPSGFSHRRDYTIPRNIALLSRASAKRRGTQPWAPGIYTGTITHLRGAEILGEKTATVGILP